MLKGEKPIDFKRAVFITENAYLDGQLNYQVFCNNIPSIAEQLKDFIKLRRLDGYKTAGNYAAFTYMIDTLPLNNYNPYVEGNKGSTTPAPTPTLTPKLM